MVYYKMEYDLLLCEWINILNCWHGRCLSLARVTWGEQNLLFVINHELQYSLW